MRGVKSHGWLPSPVSRSHKNCSVDHFFLKLWVLASPFSGFTDRIWCTVLLLALSPPRQWAIAGESNMMEGSSGEKGV